MYAPFKWIKTASLCVISDQFETIPNHNVIKCMYELECLLPFLPTLCEQYLYGLKIWGKLLIQGDKRLVAGLLLFLYEDFKLLLFYICYKNNNLNFAYVICSFKTKNQSATLKS